MNDLLAAFGLSGLKPFLGTLVMPPVPLLLLAAWGLWRMRRPEARRSGSVITWTALVLLWGLSTPLAGNALLDLLAPSPPPSFDSPWLM